MNGRNRSSLTGLALLGSVLVFAGWVLAIVPAIRNLHHVVLITVVTVVGLALFLIPGGSGIFSRPESGGKVGIPAEIVALAPAIMLFLIAVFVVPTSSAIKVAAIVVEALGMIVYGRAWFLSHGYEASNRAGSIGRGSGAAAG